MTMLDRMRRHKNWLKWSLALVILAFIILYIPSFLDQDPGAAPGDVIAEVEGREITAREFQRVYRQQIQAYQSQYGGNISEQLIRQLGIDRQIVQQMIDEEAQLAEARRLGIGATDAEVREYILSLPAFQENGRFIGEDRYRQFLRMQRPPVSPGEFEESIRKSLMVQKLRAAVTGWISVSEAEVDEEFRRRNEKVKLEVVAFPSSKYAASATVTDEEVAARFEKNKEDYRVPEKRKVRYLLVDPQSFRAGITATEQDLQRAYNERMEQYSTPEQVRASHILLKTGEGKDEAAVKKQAEELLAQVKAGADFAALATKHSEDEASRDQGGDLDFFGKGRMVAEFEQAAFALQPGQVSDLVKTSYGYHIIKVTDRKAATTKGLDELRAQLTEQIVMERAEARAQEAATQIIGEIRSPADLDRVAKTRGLRVQESGHFAQSEPILGLGFSPAISAAAFGLDKGEVSDAIRTPQGQVFITVTDVQASYLPKLDEVKDKVREDLKQQKAGEAARQKAADVLPALRSASNFTAAAKGAGLEAKTTELVARGSALPDVGASAAIDAAAFELPVGGVSDPILADSGAAIVKVVERKDVTPAEIAAGRDTLRQELLDQARGRFFGAYMDKAKEKMDIQINTQTLARAVA
jgi:peptidyl-prolyl cis-trans isomerase D